MTGLRRFGWELLLALFILIAGTTASLLSRYYLSFGQITYSLQQSIAVIGTIAAGLVPVIIVGEIDISQAAMLAFGNILFAFCSAGHLPLVVALPAVVVMCTAMGILNGVLVTAFALPSLAVTLGTMEAYRALALLVGGHGEYASFGAAYVWLGSATIAGSIPVSLLFLIVIFAAFTFLLHGTVFGRLAFAVGNNAKATAMSGVRVGLVKIIAFAIAGGMAGVGSLIYIGQYQSARADNANDILLLIVTAVVLGGIDIFGGRGNVPGVLLSLLLLGTVENGMGLANVPGPVQTLVVGTILVVSVLVPLLLRLAHRTAARARRPPSFLQPATHPPWGGINDQGR
ncbi:MAG TPA: ABC transporter permease [Acetobacteraceae bacterium]|nr:ABC transporter permease [Acetobacteraceae bacterium]